MSSIMGKDFREEIEHLLFLSSLFFSQDNLWNYLTVLFIPDALAVDVVII